MSALLQLTLGILTAMGGFIDIGELVFNIRAGAQFGYGLLWAIFVGVIIIITYSEMSGRIAAVIKKPVTTLIRERLGYSLGLCTIVVSVIVNAITAIAELGGVAFVLHLLTGLPYMAMVLVATVLLGVIMWMLSFKVLERLFGLFGLFMLTFVASLFYLHVPWKEVPLNFIPHLPSLASKNDYLMYLYFAIGIISATIMPYETFFYSSGGIEEKWTPKDTKENVITTVFGFSFGSLLAVALMVIGAAVFMPRNLDPQLLDASIIAPMFAFGKTGVIISLIGVLFALGGAVVETALSTAYNITQFFDIRWGKQKKAKHVPIFSGGWIGLLLLGFIVLFAGVDPIQLTEYSVVFSVVLLPLVYLPVLLTANDKNQMGKFVNNTPQKIWSWIVYILILIIAIAAIPLTLLTHMGQL